MRNGGGGSTAKNKWGDARRYDLNPKPQTINHTPQKKLLLKFPKQQTSNYFTDKKNKANLEV